MRRFALALAVALSLPAAAGAVPPIWIQRAVPPPIVAWTLSDVLGNRFREGIAVYRIGTRLSVAVVDSRFDPPQIVHTADLAEEPGVRVRRLLVGSPAGLERGELAVALQAAQGQIVRVLRVAKGFELRLVREFRASWIAPADVGLDGRLDFVLRSGGRYEVWLRRGDGYRLER